MNLEWCVTRLTTRDIYCMRVYTKMYGVPHLNKPPTLREDATEMLKRRKHKTLTLLTRLSHCPKGLTSHRDICRSCDRHLACPLDRHGSFFRFMTFQYDSVITMRTISFPNRGKNLLMENFYVSNGCSHYITSLTPILTWVHKTRFIWKKS